MSLQTTWVRCCGRALQGRHSRQRVDAGAAGDGAADIGDSRADARSDAQHDEPQAGSLRRAWSQVRVRAMDCTEFGCAALPTCFVLDPQCALFGSMTMHMEELQGLLHLPASRQCHYVVKPRFHSKTAICLGLLLMREDLNTCCRRRR